MKKVKKAKVYGSSALSKSDIDRGYKVSYTASDLSKLDYENHSSKKPMAERISPKGRGRCE